MNENKIILTVSNEMYVALQKATRRLGPTMTGTIRAMLENYLRAHPDIVKPVDPARENGQFKVGKGGDWYKVG